MDRQATLSVCIVVHNEEAIIERCLKSIAGCADEIIVVHDGECSDRSLGIARKYTDKIFIREKAGLMEPHFVFACNLATSEWVMRIDPDEFFDAGVDVEIRELITQAKADVDCFSLDWEMWNEKKQVHSKAFQKKCIFRKQHLHFFGIMHADGRIDGKTERVHLLLRHRPLYNNVSWYTFFRKMNYQISLHKKYFFQHLADVTSFNDDSAIWWRQAEMVKKNIVWYIIWGPVKQFLGQMCNGLWSSWTGVSIAVQQYIYYFNLYRNIWKIKRQINVKSK